MARTQVANDLSVGESTLGRWQHDINVVDLLLTLKSDEVCVALDGERRPIWEAPDLAKRQKEVIRWVAEGGNIPTLARQYEIKPDTAYGYLFSARQTLNNISSREIYAGH